MEKWKRNLWISCCAGFIVSIGMSQMAPMLPLYIADMGIRSTGDIEKWSGIIFGCNFISLAIFSPIWGRLSDRYGRKPMALRASLWLGFIMIGMGFAQSVYQLAALRLAQGAMSGFQTAIIPLIAQESPREHSGWALGMFFTSQVTGTLLGPLIGGFLYETVGIRYDFFVIGALCFLGFFLLFRIHETIKPQPQAAALTLRDTFLKLPSLQLIVGLFVTTFVMQFAVMSIEPIITIYVGYLAASSAHIALIAGAVFSCTGIASMLVASRLGRLADHIGSQKVLFAALCLAGVALALQGFAVSPLQLGIYRFMLGLAIAGLLPSVNNLVRQYTPSICLGRIYGFNQSAQFLGMFAGAFFGGHLAAAVGIRNVFFLTAFLFLINAVWCLFVVCRYAQAAGEI
ncbi:MFS transporter [Megasphaera cerevisiae]|uniref:MFS transporter n=1 Tax=Megasphaera cerevisiae TaxID=39029 RepID=UPI0009456C35|nr:MFS transporter [Megasphaera cerevisiae]OKY54682.1 MFS transporter [Megasphaera cerevisiae]